MKKKIINIALSLVSVVGMFGLYVTFGSTPAHAAWSSCPNGLFCAWDLANGSGTPWTYSFSPTNTCRIIPNNQLIDWSSVWNRIGSNKKVNIYNNSSCLVGGTNKGVTIQNNQQVNLVNLGFDNQNIAFKVWP